MVLTGHKAIKPPMGPNYPKANVSVIKSFLYIYSSIKIVWSGASKRPSLVVLASYRPNVICRLKIFIISNGR